MQPGVLQSHAAVGQAEIAVRRAADEHLGAVQRKAPHAIGRISYEPEHVSDILAYVPTPGLAGCVTLRPIAIPEGGHRCRRARNRPPPPGPEPSRGPGPSVRCAPGSRRAG